MACQYIAMPKLLTDEQSLVNPLLDVPNNISEKEWCRRFVEFFHGLPPQPNKKPPFSLQSMPKKIWQELCSKLEPCDRLVARKVTRRFRQTIDEQDNLFNALGICFEDDETRIYFNEKTVFYTSVGNECRIVCENKKRLIKGGDHRQIALQDFEKSLTKKTVARTFYVLFQTVQDRPNIFCVLSEVLSSMISLKVRKLSCELSNKEMDTILPCFETKTLEIVHFFPSSLDSRPKFMDTMMFKNVKAVLFNIVIFSIKIEHFFHLTYFDISVDLFTKEDAIKIRDILMRSDNFKYANFALGNYDPIEIANVFIPNYQSNHWPIINYTRYNKKFLLKITPTTFKIKKIDL